MVLMPIGIHSIKALFVLTLIMMVIPPCYGPSSNTPGLSGIFDASGFCNIQVVCVSQKYLSGNQVNTERKKNKLTNKEARRWFLSRINCIPDALNTFLYYTDI